MLLLLNILIVSFLGLHFVFTKVVINGLKKNENTLKQKHNHSVSVLIAARNEEANIIQLLDSINKNTFSKSRFEVIIVDDHSEDQTSSIVNKWIVNHGTTNVTLISAEVIGKKKALKEGLKICKNEIILQTDADCIVPETWIESMTSLFVKPDVQMVAGPVQLDPLTNTFEKLQGLEFSSLIASSIGLSQKGWSIMANAANLAYLKSSREHLVFNEKSESGDDVFFIQHLAKKAPESIVYLSTNASLVQTKPSATIIDFLNQRARWASKTSEYPDLKGKLVALYVLLLNIISIAVIANLLSGTDDWILSLSFLITRFLLDFSILKLYSITTLKKSPNTKGVILLSLIYPLYILSVMAVVLFGKTNWKGRDL